MIVAVDQGSSSTKALVIDPKSGKIRRRIRIPLPVMTPRSIITSVIRVLKNQKASVIGIANQRSTLCIFPVDGSLPGKIAKLVPWWETSGIDPSCVSSHAKKRFRIATGLPFLPNWWAGKLAKNIEKRGGSEMAGTVDAMLLTSLTGVCRTDTSNAARTGLFDIHRLVRTNELLDLFGIPRDFPLPEIVRSDFDFGAGVRAVLGDAGASLLGATGGEPGIMNLTLGTGGFIHLPISKIRPAPEGLYVAPAWHEKRGVRWALEGAVPGMALALREGMRVARLPRRVRARSSDLIAIVLPVGMGAFGSHEKGIWLHGDWANASGGEKMGALYRGLAFLVARAVSRFPEPRAILAGGGLSQSDFMLQAISDLTGHRIRRVQEPETTAWGAAMLAARAINCRLGPVPAGTSFEPAISSRDRTRIMKQFESFL